MAMPTKSAYQGDPVMAGFAMCDQHLELPEPPVEESIDVDLIRDFVVRVDTDEQITRTDLGMAPAFRAHAGAAAARSMGTWHADTSAAGSWHGPMQADSAAFSPKGAHAAGEGGCGAAAACAGAPVSHEPLAPAADRLLDSDAQHKMRLQDLQTKLWQVPGAQSSGGALVAGAPPVPGAAVHLGDTWADSPHRGLEAPTSQHREVGPPDARACVAAGSWPGPTKLSAAAARPGGAEGQCSAQLGMADALGAQPQSGGCAAGWEDKMDYAAAMAQVTWDARATGEDSGAAGEAGARPQNGGFVDGQGRDTEAKQIQRVSSAIGESRDVAQAAWAYLHGGEVGSEREEYRTEETRSFAERQRSAQTTAADAEAQAWTSRVADLVREWEQCSKGQGAPRTSLRSAPAVGAGSAAGPHLVDQLVGEWEQRGRQRGEARRAGGEARRAPAEAPKPEAHAEAPSSGSLGHPQLCARPCLFQASGTCTNGAGCAWVRPRGQLWGSFFQGVQTKNGPQVEGESPKIRPESASQG